MRCIQAEQKDDKTTFIFVIKENQTSIIVLSHVICPKNQENMETRLASVAN